MDTTTHQSMRSRFLRLSLLLRLFVMILAVTMLCCIVLTIRRWTLENRLYDAVMLGEVKEVKSILDCGINPNVTSEFNRNRRPLHYAAGSGRTDIAALLLTHGADINAKDNHGMTALNWTRDEKMIGFLRQHGAKEIDSKDK